MMLAARVLLPDARRMACVRYVCYARSAAAYAAMLWMARASAAAAAVREDDIRFG